MRVLRGGDVGDKRAGEVVQEGELVQGASQLLKAAGGGKQGLGNVSLRDVKVWGEDVSQRQGAGASPGLQRENLGGVSVDVGVLGGRPALGGNVEVEGLGRVGKDLVGQLVGDLLDEQLGSHISCAEMESRDTGRPNGRVDDCNSTAAPDSDSC